MSQIAAYLDEVLDDVAESRRAGAPGTVGAAAVQVVRARSNGGIRRRVSYESLRPVGLRRWFQALFVGMNWLIALMLVPSVLSATTIPLPQRLEALAGLAGLEAWLVLGYALGRFPMWLDPAAFAALLIVFRGVPPADLALAVVYNAMWVRGLSGSWKGTASGAAAAILAYVAGTYADHAAVLSPDVAGQVVGLAGIAALATIMAAMLLRADHTFRIQRELSALGAKLVAASDLEALGEAAASAVLNLAPRDEPAIAIVHLGQRKFALERTRRGRIVSTTEVGDARMKAGGMSADVNVEGEIAGHVGLYLGSRSAVDVTQAIDVVATELGFALERIRLMDSLRRESAAKSRFLATMSHELRTPLNSILGFAQLLSNPRFDPLTERQARYVKHVEKSGLHLLSLIDDVLDLSGVSAGRTSFSFETFDVDRLVAEAVAEVRPLAESRRVELRHESRPSGDAYADRVRTSQIVANLLVNAIKFTSPGGRVIAGQRGRGQRVEVCVRDRGIGIPAEELARIFEPFTQLDSGKTRTVEGSGLGLALSRHLAEAMGGTLTAVSRMGKGSAFMLVLPRAAQAGAVATRPEGA